MSLRSIDVALEEARRIVAEPTGDRLDGKLGQEAESVILRLLEESGLDYAEGLRLLSALSWSKWHEGWTAGYSRGGE